MAADILDPRDFGCPWNNVDDDLPGLQAMLASVPIENKRTIVQLPRGQGYCSDNLRINRNVEFRGHGRAITGGFDIHNGIRFPCMRGVILDAVYVSSDAGSGDFAVLRDLSIRSTQAIVTDEVGNNGSGNYFLSTTLDVWSVLPATVQLGTVSLRSGTTVGTIGDPINEGATRNLTHVVMFRCTTKGAKGDAEPRLFATAGIRELGKTIPATGVEGMPDLAAAVWTVESIPKDYRNVHAYVVGERIFIPGDNDHVFEALVGGTSKGWATTIAAGSDGAVLSHQPSISVADTSTFPASGTARVNTSSGFQVVTYTGVSGGNTLTGCKGGVGAMSTGGAVTAPFNFDRWGIGARVPNQSVAPPYRGKFFDRETLIEKSMDGAVLPQNTITVYDGTAGTIDINDFAACGTIQVWTGAAYVAVAYTGKTATAFTGCTGGIGTLHTNYPVGQGILWQHVPASCITNLTNSTELLDCSLYGATGCAEWVQAAADPSVTKNRGSFTAGSDFWVAKNILALNCGSCLTINSFNANGGHSYGWQTDFIGGGRTNVDGPNYLNLAAPKFGNAGCGVKDRSLGTNFHTRHYGQSANGMPFRNDLFGIAGPVGNSGVWEDIYGEVVPPSRILDPAIGMGFIGTISDDSTAVILSGGGCRNIKGTVFSSSNPAKSIFIEFARPSFGNAAAPFAFKHSDDLASIGFSLSEDVHPAFPQKWYAWGKAYTPGSSDAQAYLFPRPNAGAKWPSGGSANYGSASNLPMWFNLDDIWIGSLINVDPRSIGFADAIPVAGFYTAGSIKFNRLAGAGISLGWVCTAAGTWQSLMTMADPSIVIPALTIDWEASRVFTKTLAAGANTITFSNPADGRSIVVVLTGSGSTVTWPAVKWPGGTAPTQTTSGTDVYTFVQAGATIYGSFVQAMAS